MIDSMNQMTTYLSQENPNKEVIMDVYLPLIFVGFLGYMILLRIGDMASHLTGGASAGLGADFTRTMNMFANTTTAVSTGVVATAVGSKALTGGAIRGAGAGISAGKDTFARLKGE